MGEIFLIASLSSFLCFKPGARNLLENEKEGETGNKMHHTRCWMGETETLPSPITWHPLQLLVVGVLGTGEALY